MRLVLLYSFIWMSLLSGFSGKAQDLFPNLKAIFAAGNYKLALEQASLATPTTSSYDSILYLKAYAQIKLDLWKDGASTVSKLQMINPAYSEAYFLKGLISAKKERYAEAISYFNKVTDADPSHEKALYNLALAKGLLEDYSGAIKDLDKCLAANPAYTSAYYNRGYWHELSEQYDMAINDYTRAIALDPHYTEAYIALTYVYSKNGDKVSACETLHRAQAEGIESAKDLLQEFCQ